MAKKTKNVTMTVTVRCPSWLPAAAARQEVRTLINDQCFYGHKRGGAVISFEEIDEDNFRAVKVTP